MIVRPRTVLDATTAAARAGDYRAGGTDLQERLELGLVAEPIVDLSGVEGLDEIVPTGDGLRLGAGVTVARLARDDRVVSGYGALALAAAALATPQIRAVATLGGNLCQASRCWYYRSSEHRCYRSGGDTCPARGGDHLYGVCFDLGPCVAPHPSTLGAALLCTGARIEIAGGEDRTIEEFFGDGTDAKRGDTLSGTELLTAVILPPSRAGERTAYFRAIARKHAEWPLVEVSVALLTRGDVVEDARVAVGGVANVPLRLGRVEAELEGARADAETLGRAARRAAEGATPLPMTGYKVQLLPAAVLEALETALGENR